MQFLPVILNRHVRQPLQVAPRRRKKLTDYFLPPESATRTADRLPDVVADVEASLCRPVFRRLPNEDFRSRRRNAHHCALK